MQARNPGLTGIVKPKDCIFLFGIPTTTREFVEAQNAGMSDFALHLSRDVFEQDLLPPLRRATKALTGMGVTVRSAVGIIELGRALQERWPVLVLYSHWINRLSSVELHGGDCTPQKMVELIPNPYSGGLIDLTVCTAKPLALAAIAAQKGAFVKYSAEPLDALMMLWVYIGLFGLLSTKDLPYLDAFSATIDAFTSGIGK